MTLPRSAVVVGIGASGVAAARALASRGVHTVACDDRGGTDLERRAAELVAAGVAFVAPGPQGSDHSLLQSYAGRAELFVASPGVPQSHPLLAAALDRGVPVWSEPELAWRLSEGRTRVVAVTGTNGKTTTTELVAECLGVPAVGNIGTPMVQVLAAPDPPPLVVAELSSFQLRFADTLRPDVAVLLNVAPDHLDWHGTVDAYRAAKARIWAAQQAGDRVVAGADDDGARATVEAHPPPGRLAWFRSGAPADGEVGVADGWITQRLRAGAPERVAEVARMALRGPHNVANACAAVAAALLAGGDPERIAATVAAFHPGPHRMEPVASAGGVDWVNDSKATNPHAAAAALSAYPSVVWIAGGLTKGLRFDELRPLLPGRVRVALTIGSGGPEIAALVRGCGVEAIEAGTLDEAVARAAGLARPGDTVLLSPACASMDQFRDYAERGQRFRELAAAAASVSEEVER
ncbi:MAG TPA: UDP-N-acetylmuramoyl-L-alanine--D-glutamate ligase [Egibacteraceae bacterium]|nr:UDP-N-acetylmuramoyl-L-alanine--D-glutamate ligase [Egibacteraceae bacterium]